VSADILRKDLLLSARTQGGKDMTIDRRRLLLCSGGLAGSLLVPLAFVGAARAQELQEEEEDPGYDLEMQEIPSPSARSISSLPKPPSRFVVNPEFLPPVGNQGSAGSCVSWATGYGLTTFMLARKDNKDPANPANQVSPAYLYSTVRNAMASGCHTANDVTHNSCNGKKSAHLGTGGTNISMTLAILHEWGAVSGVQCPYPKPVIGGRKVVSGALYDHIFAAWSATSAEPTMKIRKIYSHKMQWEQPNSLNEIKAVLAQNEALVYGTRLPHAWKTTAFDPEGRPWERYRKMARKGDGKLAGHAMMIIGYDDEMESAGGSKGAILLQNSWGPDWGMSWSDAFKRQYPNVPDKRTRGYAWITYEAFRALAQGHPEEGLVFSIEV